MRYNCILLITANKNNNIKTNKFLKFQIDIYNF